jgi:uncharacterized protein (TIGR03435 family)
MTRVFRAAMVLILLETPTPWVRSQPTTSQPAFEVATVKPSRPSDSGVRGGCHGIDSVYGPVALAKAPPLGRCVITDARLSHLVSIAWKMGSMNLIEDGPLWSEPDERFNVEAKAENTAQATEQQLLTMLQGVIVERFQMKFHRETREIRGFSVVVAKNGPKLHDSRSEDESLSFADGSIKPRPGQPVSLRAHRYSIPILVNFLTTFGGHGSGVDKTGLGGVYDFTLAWDEENGPTIEAALREQLGLRMEMGKVSASYFVIDSAQRPSPN